MGIVTALESRAEKPSHLLGCHPTWLHRKVGLSRVHNTYSVQHWHTGPCGQASTGTGYEGITPQLSRRAAAIAFLLLTLLQ